MERNSEKNHRESNSENEPRRDHVDVAGRGPWQRMKRLKWRWHTGFRLSRLGLLRYLGFYHSPNRSTRQTLSENAYLLCKLTAPLKALRRIFGESAADEGVDLGRQGEIERGCGKRLPVSHLVADRHRAVALKGSVPGHHVVKDHTKREKIGPAVH